MQRGRGGRDDFFGFGGQPFGFGGIGGFGRPRSLMSSFSGGTDPFDDPFFTRPFESMMDHGLFGPGGSIFGAISGATHGGFLQHENFPPNRPQGPIIKELTSDDEDEQKTDLEKRVIPRKHLRPNKDPYVEEPEDDVEGTMNKQLCNINEFNRANTKRQQNGSYFFQSSTVSCGGPGGTYYTSSTTRRAGGDGVVMEESKEADLAARKAIHRLSRGMHEKGHSVTRKLNSDGRVDTVQTLRNLNEDELQNFEEDWNGKAKARQYFPEWSSTLSNDKMMIYEGDRQKLEPSRRLALPSMSQAQPQSSWTNAGAGQEGQSFSKMASPAAVNPKPQTSGRMQSQTRPNPYDGRFC